MSEIDPQDFRRAASHFLTGVTVITTTGPDGEPAGLTVNSFTTVSLKPPLVLFCLGRDSDSAAAFAASNGYVVHVLAGDQADLSARFAAKGADKFDGIEWSPGHNGLPVLAEALATFECSHFAEYEGGDHVILVGKVEHLTYEGLDREALGYFRGRYLSEATPE